MARELGGSLRVAVVGSGVVGTATGAGLASRGHEIIFCDTSLDRVGLLRRQGFHSVDAQSLWGLEHDVYLISVPSPTREGEVDLSFVVTAAETVGRAIAEKTHRPLVVVRSTVPPGTTEEVVRPIVEQFSGLTAGAEFGLCMNPEFLRAASAEEDFLRPRVIVIGALDEPSDRRLRALYASWHDVTTLSVNLRTAEMTKYVANLFNAAKISFFNELEEICAAIGVDARSAFNAAARGAEGLWNPEYGTRGLFPYGGACLPKDSVGFLGYARRSGLADELLMLGATIATNERIAHRYAQAVDSREDEQVSGL
jgi:UDPglucose 6-dehydrogenase